MGKLAGNFSIRDRTQFFVSLEHRIAALGGLFNAHLHIDRAETLGVTLDLLGCADLPEASAISPSGKHALIPMVHASACYDPFSLEMRVTNCIERLAALGTVRADRLSGSIDFRVGACGPLGFRDDAPRRWEMIEQAAARADFLGARPERDDQQDYPDHIGFEESCRRFLNLAQRTGKSVHIHVDQRNHDHEPGGKLVQRLSREMGLRRSEGAEPLIWLIHMISPSTYEEDRFAALAAGLADEAVGVIYCPSAAINMRQIRPIASPTSNSTACVLELFAAGVHVRLGSDNVCDITSPASTLDLRDELFVLAHALQFYDIDVLAKLATGKALTPDERARVVFHLEADRRELEAAVAPHHMMAER